MCVVCVCVCVFFLRKSERCSDSVITQKEKQEEYFGRRGLRDKCLPLTVNRER